jgi:cytochrome P450
MQRTAPPSTSSGPRGLPLLGVLPRMLADPCALAVELMRSSDDVVPLRLGPTTVYFVHHPDHLQHIMLDNHHNYAKGPLFARADILVGNGLVVSHGEPWLRQRRLMAPPFARKRLREIVPTIAKVVDQRLARWRDGDGRLEMWREMTGITMSALLETIFATNMDEAMVRRFVDAFDTVVDHVGVRALAFFLPERFPLPGRTAALAARDELHRIIDALVVERRRRGDQGNDLLGLLLAARDEHGEGMSDEQLRDEIKTAVFAGYDSTATGLAFTLYLLATHPESARHAREEVMQVMPEGLPSADQVEQLDYLGRVFRDALRLYPPLAFHPRMALDDDVIGGQRIPAGATLLYSNYAPGRNPAFWQYPDSFYPDHFVPDAVAKRHRFAYQPFAIGPRGCLGMAMAMLEAQIVLALILRDYELVRPLNTPIFQGRMGTSRAKGGVWLELRPARRS